jgi:hypothetical protein
MRLRLDLGINYQKEKEKLRRIEKNNFKFIKDLEQRVPKLRNRGAKYGRYPSDLKRYF